MTSRASNRQRELDAMGVGRRLAEEETEEERRRILFLGAAACLGWCAAGLFCIGWSAHSTNVTPARFAYYAGLLVGNGGILATLLRVKSQLDTANVG